MPLTFPMNTEKPKRNKEKTQMIGIVSITKQGNALALYLSNILDDSVCYTLQKWEQDNFEVIQGSMKDFCEILFQKHEALVFIMATGIVVRSIAPWLKDKTTDPAVIVLDEKGQHVISLLSGHLGGANALTLKIATLISANPVITTASDVNHLPSVDMLAQSNGLVIDNMHDAKVITAMIVNGQRVVMQDEFQFFGHDDLPQIEGKLSGQIIISNKKELICEMPFVKLIPKNIFLGVGCKRDTEPQKLIDFVLDMMKKMNLDVKSINSISSIDIKSNEKAIIEASKKLNCPLKFYSKVDLQKVDHLFKGSAFVLSTVGVASVSSTSAYLSGARKGEFILEKETKEGMTLSIFENNNY